MFKSVLSVMLAVVLALALAACAGTPAPSSTSVSPPAAAAPAPAASEAVSEAPTEEASTVKITGSDGIESEVIQSPKRVAIYDYAILDILDAVGFENTGIEQLVVPSKDSLPDELAYYKNLGDDKVVSGGSLFYVDWDVLDLVEPEVVILGGRSFGMNAAGERLDSDANKKFREDTEERYADASFVRLAMNTSNSQLITDMESNVAKLAEIFPDLAPRLEAKMAEVKAAAADISEKAQASGKRALFCMMVDQTTLSVFNPESRFDMLYEDFGFIPVDDSSTDWTDQHGFDVRAEYVLEKNPDVIFVLDRSATVGSGAGAENFRNDPVIAKTAAAANCDIYVLSGNAWYTMTGGFTSVEVMLADVNQYISTLG